MTRSSSKPAQQVIPCCANCKFFKRDDSHAMQSADHGECIRFPPQVFWIPGEDESGLGSNFPPVDSDALCGEHHFQVQ